MNKFSRLTIGEEKLEFQDLREKIIKISQGYDPNLIRGVLIQSASMLFVLSGADKEIFLQCCETVFDSVYETYEEHKEELDNDPGE